MGVPFILDVGSFSCMRIWRIRALLRVRMRGDMHLVPAIFLPLIAGWKIQKRSHVKCPCVYIAGTCNLFRNPPTPPLQRSNSSFVFMPCRLWVLCVPQPST